MAGAGATVTARKEPGLYRRVERRVPELARALIEVFLEEIPRYDLLPQEQREGELTAGVEDNLHIFFRSLREERPPTDEELAGPRAAARRRAEERVPLEAVLSAYHVGAHRAWEMLVDAARRDEREELLAAADAVLRYLRHVTGAVATAYLDEQQAIYGEELDARRSLTQALLVGAPAHGLARRLGIGLAPAYVVGILDVGGPTEGDEAGAGAHRRARQLQECLDRHAGVPVLALLDGGGGSFLLPADVDGLEQVAGDLDVLAEDITAETGSPATIAGAAAETVTDVPEAMAQAGDVLDLVQRLGRPPGAYRLDDVLVEYQLTRESDALPLLSAALEPLAGNPDLLVTLETYLAHDQDRRSTAAALHVHPNTLDYRLRRIVDLTGLDTSTTRGLQILAAALTARRLEQ